jgi:hypothetical protein
MNSKLLVPIDVEVERRAIELNLGDELEVENKEYGNAPQILVLQNEKYREVVLPENAKAFLTVVSR